MLETAQDSVQPDDWVVVPNLPEDGLFLIGEVAGSYYYEPLKIPGDTDVNDLGHDYGHVLPLRLLTPESISRYAEQVAAGLRGSLRTPMRMWSLDGYGEALERLVNLSREGKNLATATSGEARLDKAWKLARMQAAQLLRDRLGSELDARFQAAEWELPVKKALEGLYPGTDVHWVAGPNERGADVTVQISDPFGGLPWLILVQVKNYTGRIGADVVVQLRTAYEHYSKDGTVLALVVMTTAEEIAADLAEASAALSAELRVPVHVVLRKRMMKILSDGLMASLARAGAGDEIDDV